MSERYAIRETIEPVFGLVFMLKKVADKVLRSAPHPTMAQLRMLIAIRRNPSLSQRDIAEFWNMTEASASRQIGLLDERGLIYKKRDPKNRRKYVLKLTKDGEAKVHKAMTLMHGVLESAFKDVGSKDRRELRVLLVKFTEALKRSELVRGTVQKNKNKNART